MSTIHNAALELERDVIGVPVKKIHCAKLANIPHIFITLVEEKHVFTLGYLSSGWMGYPIVVGYEENPIMVTYCPISMVNSVEYAEAKRKIESWMAREPEKSPPNDLVEIEEMEQPGSIKKFSSDMGYYKGAIPGSVRPGFTREPPPIKLKSVGYSHSTQGPMEAYEKFKSSANSFFDKNKRIANQKNCVCNRCKMELDKSNLSSLRFDFADKTKRNGDGTLIMICQCGYKNSFYMTKKDKWCGEYEFGYRVDSGEPQRQPLSLEAPREYDEYGYPIL